MLLHVVDASSEHAAVHRAHVDAVLRDIGAEGIPRMLVLNKCDRLPDGGAALLAQVRDAAAGAAVFRVSALTGDGCEALLDALDRQLLHDPVRLVRFHIPHTEVGKLGLVHSRARVLERAYTETEYRIDALAPESLIRKLSAFAEDLDEAAYVAAHGDAGVDAGASAANPDE